MKLKISAFFVAPLLASSLAVAGSADDKQRIDQCLTDSRDEGAKTSMVRKYCECVNNLLRENKIPSLSQWEKCNPKEMWRRLDAQVIGK